MAWYRVDGGGEKLTEIIGGNYTFSVSIQNNTLNAKFTITEDYIELYTLNSYHANPASYAIDTDKYFDLTEYDYIYSERNPSGSVILVDESDNEVVSVGALLNLSKYNGRFKIRLKVSIGAVGNQASASMKATTITLVKRNKKINHKR